MNQKFYEGETLLAEITDSLLIVHKQGDQRFEYRLNSITGEHQIYSHESRPEHVVVFQVEDGSGQTVGVVWSDRDRAEEFKNAVRSAVT